MARRLATRTFSSRSTFRGDDGESVFVASGVWATSAEALRRDRARARRFSPLFFVFLFFSLLGGNASRYNDGEVPAARRWAVLIFFLSSDFLFWRGTVERGDERF